MISGKNIHEKLLNCIQHMLVDTRYSLPYYGEFNLHINFIEQESIGTCAVNVTTKGFNFFYNPKFLKDLSQKEVNFITIHEDFHLLFNHPKRTITGQYEHKLANIAQDMIINHVIWEDISHDFVEIPKDADGKNMTLFVPKEYTGKLIFEELYEWLKEEREKFQKNQQDKNKCKSCNGSGKKEPQENGGEGDKSKSEKGSGKGEQNSDSDGSEKGEKGSGKGGQDKSEKGDGEGKDDEGHDHSDDGEPCDDCGGSGKDSSKDASGKPSYGPYGKDPKGSGTIDTWSTDKIFEDMDNNEGQYMDKHIGDEVPEEMREAMQKDITEKLAARGLSTSNIEQTLNKLQKKRKDYLKEIKRTISNMIFGTNKQKTIVKPNRRGIAGVKGNRKVKTKINVGLDTSGSMGGQGTFERVLSYVYQNDIEINFMESDTEVKWVQHLKNKRALESIPIKGLGGTCLQPMLQHIVDNFNDCNNVILTDGYTDHLDFSKVKGKTLIISVGTKCPISYDNGRVKQIVLDANTK